jgi:uncharacterized coiled-coil protein SlyX
MVIDVEGQLQEGCEMSNTAELIARSCPTCGYQIDRVERLTNMVAAQAQEIERLKTALMAARNRIEDDAQTIDRHVAKIGKLQNALIGRDE